jgi:hypothetical protein
MLNYYKTGVWTHVREYIKNPYFFEFWKLTYHFSIIPFSRVPFFHSPLSQSLSALLLPWSTFPLSRSPTASPPNCFTVPHNPTSPLPYKPLSHRLTAPLLYFPPLSCYSTALCYAVSPRNCFLSYCTAVPTTILYHTLTKIVSKFRDISTKIIYCISLNYKKQA